MAEVEIDFIGQENSLESKIDSLDAKLNAINMNKAEADIKESVAAIESRLDRMGSNLKGAFGAAIGLISIEKLKGIGQQILQVAGESEQFKDRVEGLQVAMRNVQLTVAEYLIPALEFAVDIGTQGFSALETAAKNMGLTWEIAWDTVALAGVRTWGQIEYFFTEQLPSWLKWLGENWQNILTDMANFAKVWFSNMLENWANLFETIWNFLAGDDSNKWEWRGMTEGFKSSLEELPEIAARKKSELEQSLELRIGANMEAFGKEFDKNLKKNKELLSFDDKKVNEEQQKKLDGFGKSLMDGLKSFGESVGGVSNTAGAAAATLVDDVTDAIAGKDRNKEQETLEGSTIGLTELFNRISGAAATPEQKAAQDTAKNTKEQVTATEKVVTEVKGVGTTFLKGLTDLGEQIKSIGALK